MIDGVVWAAAHPKRGKKKRGVPVQGGSEGLTTKGRKRRIYVPNMEEGGAFFPEEEGKKIDWDGFYMTINSEEVSLPGESGEEPTREEEKGVTRK